VVEACVGDVFGGYGGVMGLELEGDEAAVGRQGAGEADGAVAAEGADFEDAFCALHEGEEVEESALGGADVDGRKICGGVGGEGGFEDRVGRDEGVVEVVVDVGPDGVVVGLLHGEASCG
jgi:hypothetical protein